jgi:hypothetical protein
MSNLRTFLRSQPGSRPPDRRALGGVLVRRERWGLSWRGRFLVLLVAAIVALFVILRIHSFLAVTSRVQSDYLVVEGWMHYVCFEQAALEFRRGNYKILLTSGVRRNMGLKGPNRDTYAQYAAEQLKDFGMPDELVKPVPCWVERKDRTYNSALAVKKWFADNGIKIKSLDVATEGPHARRTHLLYQKAFGNEVKIGIIAFQDPTYDVDHWWRFSEGVREVIGETVAYAYARILFPIFGGAGANSDEGDTNVSPKATAGKPVEPALAPATNAVN